MYVDCKAIDDERYSSWLQLRRLKHLKSKIKVLSTKNKKMIFNEYIKFISLGETTNLFLEVDWFSKEHVEMLKAICHFRNNIHSNLLNKNDFRKISMKKHWEEVRNKFSNICDYFFSIL